MGPVWGIDFGKKLSGNTVICEKSGDLTRFYRASKDTDADRFITGLIKDNRPDIIFIDAPLSLPGAYCDSETYQDYFYRLCDRQLNAMSPMFLGGLTARAISLKTEIEKMGIDIKETYPKALAKKYNLKSCGYKVGNEFIKGCLSKLEEISYLKIDDYSVISWHHFDALLALIAAIRYSNKLHITYGDKYEGLIYI